MLEYKHEVEFMKHVQSTTRLLSPLGDNHFDNQKAKPRGFLVINGHNVCYLVYVDVCIHR
jgi:hypothetical protein